jgi:hypothetical protein
MSLRWHHSSWRTYPVASYVHPDDGTAHVNGDTLAVPENVPRSGRDSAGLSESPAKVERYAFSRLDTPNTGHPYTPTQKEFS